MAHSHEYDYPNQPWKPEWSNYGKDSGGECGVPYSVRFHMPNDDNTAGKIIFTTAEQSTS